MNFWKDIMRYCEDHSTPADLVLYELERETYLKTLAPQMMSGKLQGQLLRFLSLMIRPQAILEIGTFTGYASICLAQGLPQNGILHTIEANPEYAFFGKKYFPKAGLSEKIIAHIGRAEEVIPKLPIQFDLAFIDAGKNDYAGHYDLVFDKIRAGGYILADNVLWSGKVVQKEKDADTAVIRAFNDKVQHDERVEKVMLPIRDGLFIIRKKI
jgi:predicted O-methyltransferase YrrM